MKSNDSGLRVKVILEQQKPVQLYTINELKTLLQHWQVKGLSGLKKDALLIKWKEILDSKREAPAYFDGWTPEDEARLQLLSTRTRAEMGDTALARELTIAKSQMNSVVNKLSHHERQELMEKLHKMKEEDVSAAELILPDLPSPSCITQTNSDTAPIGSETEGESEGCLEVAMM